MQKTRLPTRTVCLASAAATLVALSACATVEPMADSDTVKSILPKSVARAFCYEPLPDEPELKLIDETRRYHVYAGTFDGQMASADESPPITFEYYKQIANDPAPVVLVLPILNGEKQVVRPFAKYFARYGYAAIIVDTTQRTTLTEDLIEPEAAIRENVVRLRQLLDWVERQANLDADRIAVFGASLGGINALYLAALDRRISVAVPALAAGDLHYVFMRSNEVLIERAVAEAKEKLSMSSEELEAYLKANIETDLIGLAPHINADRILMVLARYDKAVPYGKQLEIREAMGFPEAITLPTGHYTAAAYLFYIRKRAREFFDRKLAEPQALGTANLPKDPCSR